MNRTSNTRILCGGGAFLAMLITSGQAFAQLDEIIVTAERRQESLQDVSVAVNAFTSNMVESLKIEDFHDLAFMIPGFSINAFSKTRFNPALRGGSSSLASAGAEQAVGLFIDDVYFGGPGDFELDLFDIERIEVLRGPQGTLFGRNTTGGLINVITKDPSEELEGKLQVSLGNYALNKFGAYVAGPVSNNVFGSLSYSSTNREGTSFNSVTGNDVDNLNRSAFRGKLIWAPSDDLEVKFALSHSTIDETGIARDAVSSQATVDLPELIAQNFLIDNEPRTVQSFNDGRYVSEQWVGSLHITKELENMTLQSITTGRDFKADQEPVSLTGLPLRLFQLADNRDTQAFTQEFRLISNSDSALSWQAGAYFMSADDTRDLHVITIWSDSVFAGFLSSDFGCPGQTPVDSDNFVVTPICLVTNPELFDENEIFINENVKTTSFSVYAQGSYEFSDQFALTLGGRYTDDEKKLKGATAGELEWNWNRLPDMVFSNSADWGEFTWKAVLDYNVTSNALMYASASTGFRSGAYDMAQTDTTLIDQPVGPETVTSLELGLKSRFFDNRAQLNIAVFDTTYEDLQFFVSLGVMGRGGALTTNAGEATVQGVEVDFTWAIADALTFNLAYSHQDGDSKGIPPEAEIPAGTPPQGTVPNTYIAALDYATDTASGEFYFHIDYLVKDEYTLEFIDNAAPQFRSEVDGQLNVNLGLKSERGWGVQIWGKNLTDELIVLYGQDFFFIAYDAVRAFANPDLFNSSFGPRYTEPRTYGVSVSYEF